MPHLGTVDTLEKDKPGYRRSEALALVWDSLDLDLCVLSVKQTLHRSVRKKFIINPLNRLTVTELVESSKVSKS